MKKSLIAASLVLVFGYLGSAQATGMYCMGSCENNHTPTTWNPDMSYNTGFRFNGNLNGGSSTSGTGVTENSTTYAIGEQDFGQKASVTLTEFLEGSACNGTCADNKATLSFTGEQSFKTGGMHNATGTGDTSSYVSSGAHGGFGANGFVNFD